MESDGAVATDCVAARKGVAVVARNINVVVFVPVIAAANRLHNVAGGAMFNGENQGVGAVAEGAAADVGVTHPLVAVASSDFSSGAMADEQVEGHGAVAAVGTAVREGVGYVLRRGQVFILIPVERGTDCGESVAPSCAVNSEHEGVVAIGIDAAASVSSAMPSVTVASSSLSRRAVIDGEIERHNAVATGGICSGKGSAGIARNSRSCVLSSVPNVAVASGSNFATRRAAVDGKEKGHGAVATGDGRGQITYIVAGGCVSLAMPSIAVASSGCHSGEGTIVDHQVDSLSTVASIDVGIQSRESTAGGIGRTVPLVTVASGNVLSVRVTIVNGENQGVVSIDVNATGIVGVAMPNVAIANRNLSGRAVSDTKVESHSTVATGGIGSGIGSIVVGRGVLNTMPYVAVASRDGLYAGGAVVESKVESHSAVTTDGIGGGIGGDGITANSVSHSVDPLVAVAGGSSLNARGTVIDRELKFSGAVATDGIG